MFLDSHMQRDLAGLQANLLEAFGFVAGTRFLKGKAVASV
jgi:hypothetical protein